MNVADQLRRNWAETRERELKSPSPTSFSQISICVLEKVSP